MITASTDPSFSSSPSRSSRKSSRTTSETDSYPASAQRLAASVAGVSSSAGSASILRRSGDHLVLHVDHAAEVEEEPLHSLQRGPHQSTAPRSASAAPRMPLTNPGASAPQYSLLSSTASSIATSTGMSSR